MLIACSSNTVKTESKKEAKKQSLSKGVVKRNKKTNNSFMHAHSSNPCTVAIEHSHVFTDKDHKHKYDCENTNDFVSNAHVHEATKKINRFRHVHPNGANKHSHHE